MSIAPLPSYASIVDEVARCQLGLDAAELHGSLCGYLCGGGSPSRTGWMACLTLDATAEADTPLDALFVSSIEQLDSSELAFGLLLPEDDELVSTRAEALVAWCRGFLAGFGLAEATLAELSAEGSEALEDVARIAASAFDCDDPDADEAAFAEISEFVRVAALLLHGDCVLGRRQRRKLH